MNTMDEDIKYSIWKMGQHDRLLQVKELYEDARFYCKICGKELDIKDDYYETIENLCHGLENVYGIYNIQRETVEEDDSVGE